MCVFGFVQLCPAAHAYAVWIFLFAVCVCGQWHSFWFGSHLLWTYSSLGLFDFKRHGTVICSFDSLRLRISDILPFWLTGTSLRSRCQVAHAIMDAGIDVRECQSWFAHVDCTIKPYFWVSSTAVEITLDADTCWGVRASVASDSISPRCRPSFLRLTMFRPFAPFFFSGSSHWYPDLQQLRAQGACQMTLLRACSCYTKKIIFCNQCWYQLVSFLVPNCQHLWVPLWLQHVVNCHHNFFSG